DVLVGVNLLREGLDLPEVALVCILDADKEGFLRSATALIQQMGRAARNANSHVILYADKITKAMGAAMDETQRRRDKQLAFNAANGITPVTIHKEIRGGIENILKARKTAKAATVDEVDDPSLDADLLVRVLESDMLEAAEATDFESAALLRDQMKHVRELIEQHRVDSVLDGDAPLLLRRSEIARALKPRGHKPGAANTRRGKPRTRDRK
ncbi:unnamed protein product, partial [Laminaria digitata]